jgi:hypothetical protein
MNVWSAALPGTNISYSGTMYTYFTRYQYIYFFVFLFAENCHFGYTGNSFFLSQYLVPVSQIGWGVILGTAWRVTDRRKGRLWFTIS